MIGTAMYDFMYSFLRLGWHFKHVLSHWLHAYKFIFTYIYLYCIQSEFPILWDANILKVILIYVDVVRCILLKTSLIALVCINKMIFNTYLKVNISNLIQGVYNNYGREVASSISNFNYFLHGNLFSNMNIFLTK